MAQHWARSRSRRCKRELYNHQSLIPSPSTSCTPHNCGCMCNAVIVGLIKQVCGPSWLHASEQSCNFCSSEYLACFINPTFANVVWLQWQTASRIFGTAHLHTPRSCGTLQPLEAKAGNDHESRAQTCWPRRRASTCCEALRYQGWQVCNWQVGCYWRLRTLLHVLPQRSINGDPQRRLLQESQEAKT